VIFLAGPGHGGPALVANAYLEGTYSERYHAVTQDEEGCNASSSSSASRRDPSHVAPETPGSIHEGGELGYVLAHAFGAAFDNPDLIVAAVVGDGEAETGRCHRMARQQVPQSRARRRGAPDPASQRLQDREPVLPRAHSAGRARELSAGHGLRPYFVEGTTLRRCTGQWRHLDAVVGEIKRIQKSARSRGFKSRPHGR
jgi:xylulose-5-phosphate/fructose-6-phosphate phosphoketolase